MNFEQPPQAENPPARERSPEYVKVLAELEQILAMPEEEQHAYVDNRIAALSENATKGEISHIQHKMHDGFLGAEMFVRRSLWVDPFVLDDPELYHELINAVQDLKKLDGFQDKTIRELMPGAVQWTLTRYFGNAAPGPRTEMENREFYFEQSREDEANIDPAISIKDLKGKGFAVCAEKAAAAQNLLAFSGMETTLIASPKCRIPAEAPEDAHYFILIHGPKSEMIFDPANPRLHYDKEGNLTNYGPAMYPISDEQSKQLLSGEPILVQHVDTTADSDNQQVAKAYERVYTGPQ